MKIHHLILTVMSAAAFVVAGCSKSESGAPTPTAATPAASVDTSKLTAAFQAAEPAAKTAVDTAVTAIKKADYSDAVTQLKALGDKFKLTTEQQQVVNDMVAQVQKAIAAAASKATDAAGQAATDAAKALGK
jgi:hypothetical protein